MMTQSPQHETPAHERLLTRELGEHERPFPSRNRALPAVIDAQGARDPAALAALARAHSDELRQEVHRHGAILLRGFTIRSAGDFEKVMSSIGWLKPIKQFFMSEPGRRLVGGAETVFNTNSVKRTGGGFAFGSFHSENYHSADVPAYVAFCALKKSWLGSETCLVNAADVYAELPASLQSKLESQAYVASIWALTAVAKRYGVTVQMAQHLCLQAGLPVEESQSVKYVILPKPSVCKPAHTGRAALHVNLASTLGTFKDAALQHFGPHYRGWRWSLHRLVWRTRIDRMLFALLGSLRLLVQPREASKFLQIVMPPASPGAPKTSLLSNLRAFLRYEDSHQALRNLGRKTLGQVLSREEVELLAQSIARHASLFTWQPGDILLLDNQQLVHAGMPGLGPRKLLAMFFNRLPIRQPATTGTMQLADDETTAPGVADTFPNSPSQ